MQAKPKLRIGLVGSGFMGKTHVFGYATAERVFDLPYQLEFACVADATPQLAEAARREFGFASSTSDWRELVNDPNIDLIDITAPNVLHKEISLAAIGAGKHVYCEKPLAPLAADAMEMMLAAQNSKVTTQVGFNYLCNPMLTLARELIGSGELGEIRSYRGIHAEDYMASTNSPYTWRHDPVGGGALADLGSHALATAEFLMGPIERVLGDCVTAIDERPHETGKRAVEVDDIARAFVRFANGASGSIEGNWVAQGRKMQHDFEVSGSKGALIFTQERFNELRLYTDDGGKTSGFRTIVAGPEHHPYGLFCVAPGHQLGFNDLKAIEISGFLKAIAGHHGEPFGFSAGARIQMLVETIQHSAKTTQWRTIGEMKTVARQEEYA